MLVVLGDPPVALIAVVMVVAYVLVGVAVIVVLVFVLAGMTVIVVVFVLAFVVVVTFVLAKDADLLLIPTAARRGGISPGGRACNPSSSRGARAGSLLAGPEGVPVSTMGRLRGEVNHNCLRAVVADGDLLRGNSCGCRRGACCL